MLQRRDLTGLSRHERRYSTSLPARTLWGLAGVAETKHAVTLFADAACDTCSDITSIMRCYQRYILFVSYTWYLVSSVAGEKPGKAPRCVGFDGCSDGI